MTDFADLLAGVFLVMGAAFLAVAGAAVLSMPDLYTRISASSKAVTAGAGASFIAAGLYFYEAGVTARAIAGLGFFMLTSPVAGHVVARAAVYVRVPFSSRTVLPPGAEDEESPLRQSQ